MIQKAFGTHPSPWTAFTKSANLSFASRSIANVLLILIFGRCVPLTACPSPCIQWCLHQCVVNKSPLSASIDLYSSIHLNIPVVDKSLSKLLAKGYEFDLLTFEIGPCKVCVDFCNGKNECEDSDWPPKGTPCGLKSKTLF